MTSPRLDHREYIDSSLPNWPRHNASAFDDIVEKKVESSRPGQTMRLEAAMNKESTYTDDRVNLETLRILEINQSILFSGDLHMRNLYSDDIDVNNMTIFKDSFWSRRFAVIRTGDFKHNLQAVVGSVILHFYFLILMINEQILLSNSDSLKLMP